MAENRSASSGSHHEEEEHHEHEHSEHGHSETDSSGKSDLSPRSARLLRRVEAIIERKSHETELLIETRIQAVYDALINDNDTEGSSKKANKDDGSIGRFVKKTGHRKADSSRKKSTAGCSFKEFKACGPTSFSGSADPVKGLEWITNMEQTFSISKCSEADKITFATAMLTESAMMWWRSMTNSMGRDLIDTLTWEQFKVMFDKKYCPMDVKDKLEQKLMALEQGSLTVTEYEIEFTRLSLLSDYQVATEERRIQRFVLGLRPEIREFVRNRELVSYEKAVEYARIREHELSLPRPASTPAPTVATTPSARPHSSSPPWKRTRRDNV